MEHYHNFIFILTVNFKKCSRVHFSPELETLEVTGTDHCPAVAGSNISCSDGFGASWPRDLCSNDMRLATATEDKTNEKSCFDQATSYPTYGATVISTETDEAPVSWRMLLHPEP